MKKLDVGHAVPGYEGYTTCDIREGADWKCSATNIIQLGTFDEILCNMVLEHLRPWEIPDALYAFYFALNDDGFVDIAVPDLENIIELMSADLNEALRRLFGGSLYQGGPDDCPEQEHRWAFTYNSLSTLLYAIGFRKVENKTERAGILWVRAWK